MSPWTVSWAFTGAAQCNAGSVSGGGLPVGVGKTAIGVALVRVQESRRPDRLFADPYAEAFLAAAPRAFEVEQRAAAAGTGDMASWGAAFSSHAVTRTRFFDDYLLAATEAGIRQVVLLAAGLDTRAFRLPLARGRAPVRVGPARRAGVQGSRPD